MLRRYEFYKNRQHSDAIVQLLAQRRLEELYALDNGKEWDLAYLAEYIDDYGGVIMLPDSTQWSYDFYPVSETNEIAIDCALIIDGEISDLILQCTLTGDEVDDYYSFTLDGVHVM